MAPLQSLTFEMVRYKISLYYAYQNLLSVVLFFAIMYASFNFRTQMPFSKFYVELVIPNY